MAARLAALLLVGWLGGGPHGIALAAIAFGVLVALIVRRAFDRTEEQAR
jgi:hypothetical protein